jgi:hypothetical protein
MGARRDGCRCNSFQDPSAVLNRAGDKQAFEVASLKPNNSGPGPFAIMPMPGGRLRGTNVPAKFLVAAAD